jgi:protein ImuB
MRRIICVWLPDWPVTVWSRTAGRSSPPDPFALTDKTAHGVVLHALNQPARDLGLAMGQGHADACAAVPDLLSEPANLARDLAALEALALWAERFSPTVAVNAQPYGLEGLTLDVTGIPHLFGGEAAMLGELSRRLTKADIPARCAMADTSGAAWAMARYGGQTMSLIPEGQTREALARLPIAGLRLPGAAIKLLARLGIKRIGDLYPLPRAGLARRVRGENGLTVVTRLDQALGQTAEPLIPQRPIPKYRAAQVFMEPMTEVEGAAFWLPDLTARLAAQLERDGMGARHIRLTAFRLDGGTTSLEAVLSVPSVRPAHLIRLLREKGFEHLELGFGADALMLTALVAEPLQVRQGEMEESEVEAAADALAGLIDRLKARLGDEAVRRPVLQASHIPERSELWAVVRGLKPAANEPPPVGPRPLLIFNPPEPVDAIAELPDAAPAHFTWRRVGRRIVKSAGPERLSPEWWRPAPLRLGHPKEPPRTRDYYRVEDDAGRRYWLFRDGLYGREDVSSKPTPDGVAPDPRPPTWWIQGVFA